MDFSGNLGSNSGVSTQSGTRELQMLRSTTHSGEFQAQRAPQLGTGFETLPTLAILFKPFQFLKSLGLNSVGLGLACMSFHSVWELVECRPKLTDLGVCTIEILEIYDEIEEEEPKVLGPQIELNLENPSDLGEPPVEAIGEAPTVVEILDEPSVEGKAVEEIRTGAEPVLVDVEMETGAEPVLETVEIRTGAKPVHEDVEMGTGETPVLRAEGDDSFFEDYSGDDFEKVGEINLEETPLSLFSLSPRRKPHLALNQGGRGSGPWLGGWIYPGSGS